MISDETVDRAYLAYRCARLWWSRRRRRKHAEKLARQPKPLPVPPKPELPIGAVFMKYGSSVTVYDPTVRARQQQEAMQRMLDTTNLANIPYQYIDTRYDPLKATVDGTPIEQRQAMTAAEYNDFLRAIGAKL